MRSRRLDEALLLEEGGEAIVAGGVHRRRARREAG